MERLETYESRIILPLRCKKNTDLSRVISSRNGKNAFQKTEIITNSLRLGAENIFSINNGICKSYSLVDRMMMGLPNNRKTPLLFSRRGKKDENTQCLICVGDIQYYLFETGVSFVSIDIEFPKFDSFDDIQQFTYFLCEPKDSQNTIELLDYSVQSDDHRPGKYITELSAFYSKICSYLSDPLAFDNNKVDSTTVKPLLYSYFLFDQKPENLAEIVKNTANNYKKSYKTYSSDNGYQAYANSIWSAGANAAANISWYVDDKETNSFFKDGFKSSVMKDYFYLYLNAIHFKYASIMYLHELSLIPSTVKDINTLTSSHDSLESLQRRYGTFSLRCVLELPSYIDHINSYYSYICKALDLAGYDRILKEGISKSISLCNSYKSALDELEQLQNYKHTLYLEFFVSVLAFLVALTPFINTAIKLFASPIDLALITAVLPLLATLLTALLASIKCFEKLKSNNEQIDSLKKKATRQ